MTSLLRTENYLKLLGPLLFSVCAHGIDIPEEYREPQDQDINVILEDSKWKEACFESDFGMIVDYSFKADKPVNFNIHWHENKHVTYSVKHEGIGELTGSFEPSIKKVYCLSWNRPDSERANLTFRYTHKKIPPR